MSLLLSMNSFVLLLLLSFLTLISSQVTPQSILSAAMKSKHAPSKKAEIIFSEFHANFPHKHYAVVIYESRTDNKKRHAFLNQNVYRYDHKNIHVAVMFSDANNTASNEFLHNIAQMTMKHEFFKGYDLKKAVSDVVMLSPPMWTYSSLNMIYCKVLAVKADEAFGIAEMKTVHYLNSRRARKRHFPMTIVAMGDWEENQ